MSNLPQEHHRLNTHARHVEKALTALLWTARFRWSTPSVIDDELFGGNGLVRQLIKKKLLVEHAVTNIFSPVRYYATLGTDGLELLHRHWIEIGNGLHGEIATRLSDGWRLPDRPEHRIRESRFEHDLRVQISLARTFRAGARVDRVYLADDLERTPPAKRPAKIPDIIVEVRATDNPSDYSVTKIWGEVEFSRKNAREIDGFCAYYRGALAGTEERKFDHLLVNCHSSVLAQWRRDFARTIVPKWNFRKATRDWVKLDPKDWHRFPTISAQEIEKIIRPLE